MNRIIISGNLVDKVKVNMTPDGKISAFGKMGVYNGKTKDGQQRDSMFFDLVLFGKAAETLRDLGDKGTPIVASGRLEEDKSISQTNGQTYINKRIVCDDVVKPVTQTQYQAPVQTVPVQPQYQAPVQPQYQAPVQNQTYQQVDPFNM